MHVLLSYKTILEYDCIMVNGILCILIKISNFVYLSLPASQLRIFNALLVCGWYMVDLVYIYI